MTENKAEGKATKTATQKPKKSKERFRTNTVAKWEKLVLLGHVPIEIRGGKNVSEIASEVLTHKVYTFDLSPEEALVELEKSPEEVDKLF